MKKYLLKIMIIIFAILMVTIPIKAETQDTNVEAKVVEDHGTTEVEQNNETKEVQNVTIRFLEGEYEDEEHDVSYILSEDLESKNARDKLTENDRILVNIQEDEGEITSVVIQKIVRRNDIILMVLILLILLLVIGRKKAIKPIAIILVTVLSIYFIFINSIYKGYNLLAMSIATTVVINILVSIILNGIGRKTNIIVLSSLISSVFSGILAFLYLKLTQLSGEMFDISIFNTHLDIKELLYSGIILSSSGVCLYISSIIANYLENTKQEDTNIPWKKLVKLGIDKGMNVMTNLIYIPILLYLCSAFTLMTIAMGNNMDNEMIAIIIAYLMNAIISGIIAIPIVSVVYSFLNRNKIFYKVKSDNIIEGQRSLKL